MQVLCDDRYVGIPIVTQSFVDRGCLTVWEGPPLFVKMKEPAAPLSFKKFVLLSAAHQGIGYYGKVVVAPDSSTFFDTNGWKTQFDGSVPDFIFTKTFLSEENRMG